MKLQALWVENCRNIEKAQLTPCGGLTVIAGENGQGKTNLLECIYLLTGGKSFRAAKDQELVLHSKEQGKVLGESETQKKTSRIEIIIKGEGSAQKGRFAKINGVDYGRAAAIAGTFTAVVFEPNHLSLIKSGPDGRRKFVDAALCQLYPGYITILRRFHKALTQKNALLKRYFETNGADEILDAFDQELIKSGEEVSRRRAEYLAAAGPMAEEFYKELSSGAESLAVSFLASAPPGGLAELLAKSRRADIRARFSTAGPHREDFEVVLGGKSARTYGSQGQQRSAVLSLKLAEAAVAKNITGEHPVLLLDDVLSELDEGRQAFLLREMEGKQSFVTCCDAAAFRRAAGQVVYVKNGRVLANLAEE